MAGGGGIGGMIEFFMSPKVALIIFTLFLVAYIVFIDEEGGFQGKFLHFGPGTNAENTTSFMNIKMDTWQKVILLYIVSFFASLLTTYYQSVMSNNIHSYIWNRALKTMPYSKTWTYAIVLMEPFFYQILSVVQFFTSLTLQLQFIIPQFIGSLIADIPFTLHRLGEKRFDQL
jgi:hypothetical protein